jgi:hypothetical protein
VSANSAAKRSYTRSRQADRPRPERAKTPTTMLIRNRVVTLARIDVGDWQQKQIKHRAADVCELTAVLSDGTKVVRKAIVSYRENEREKLFEPMLRGEATPREVQALTQVVHRRCQALQRVRGELQREHGLRVVYGRD